MYRDVLRVCNALALAVLLLLAGKLQQIALDILREVTHESSGHE